MFSIFGGNNGLSQSDVDGLKAFNAQIQNGETYAHAYQNTLSGCSVNAKQMAKGVASGKIEVNSLTASFKLAEFGAKALNTAINMIANMAIMWVISAAFSALSKSIDEAKQAQEEYRRITIETGKAADEENDKLQELITTYRELAQSGGSADEVRNIQEQITELVGDQANNLDLVNGKLDEELNKLSDISVAQAKKNQGDLSAAKIQSGEELRDLYNNFFEGMGLISFVSPLLEYREKHQTNNFIGEVTSTDGTYEKISELFSKYNSSWTWNVSTGDGVYQAYKDFVEIEKEIRVILGDNYEQEALYKSITTEIGKMAGKAIAYGEALEAYNNNEAIIAIGENLKTFDESTITSQESFDNWVNSLIDSEGATGDYAEALREVAESRFPQFAKAAEEAAEGAESSIKSLTDSLKEIETISDKFEKLGTALNEFADDGTVSIKTLNEIGEEFSDVEGIDGYLRKIGSASNTVELQSAIQGLINTYLNQTNVLSGLNAENKQLLTTQLQRLGVANAETVINSKLANSAFNLAKSMTSFTSQTKANAEILLANAKALGYTGTQLKSYIELVELAAKMEELRNSKSADPRGLSALASHIRQRVNTIVNQMSKSNFNINPIDIKIDVPTLSNIGSGSSSSDNPYAKYFDNLKHRRELDIINQKQYLIELYQLNNRYYKNNSNYLDEYASNMEELYDGFKELYKEDFEAKKESLEKQKEEVEKYYDKLIDEIKEANDEEDYEEEQAEKRKTIFELKAKIDDLLRDDSQRALARAAELREELADAEKELFDFEKDNARENEIDRLEKEKETAEKAIQDQIDKIDEDLKAIDDDIQSVRQVIIDFAQANGVNIKAAYATGTLNARGGLTRINEKGLELIATPDGHGNYVNMLPASKVLTAQQTATLMALSQGQLPQAMYNSIARSIGAKVNSPAVNNYNQPITIQMGDIIIQGNADKQTIPSIRKQQEDMVRLVLNKIKELQS